MGGCARCLRNKWELLKPFRLSVIDLMLVGHNLGDCFIDVFSFKKDVIGYYNTRFGVVVEVIIALMS